MLEVHRVGAGGLTRAQVEGVAAIYEAVFPAGERRPLDDVVGAGNACTWLAGDGGTTLGFALAAVLADGQTVLLQYLGVRPDRQSGGLGTALLDAMARDLAADGRGAVVLEIEDPDVEGADPITRRRAGFYARWGAQRLACLDGYFMPDIAHPPDRLPMQLLWRPLGPGHQPTGPALRSVLAHIVENEYAEQADEQYRDDLLSRVTC